MPAILKQWPWIIAAAVVSSALIAYQTPLVWFAVVRAVGMFTLMMALLSVITGKYKQVSDWPWPVWALFAAGLALMAVPYFM